MISTRDRCAELKLTCGKLLTLDPPADEVILCADGCRDNTVEMLRCEFPQFRVISNQAPAGSVFSRARMLEAASGDIVLSLDDDSFPLKRDFFQKLETILLNHPEAAVVAFPEMCDGGTFEQEHQSRRAAGHYVSAYANCAAAMRRAFYLEQPGFPPFFTHMYEEPDYALQCYAAGAAVWFEPTLSVRHRRSAANRDPLERHWLNARNELWSVWLRCPWPWLPLVSAYRLARQFCYAGGEDAGWAVREPGWWWSALKGWRHCLEQRRPVAWRTYYHWLRLARNPIASAAELRTQFRRTAGV